MKAKGRLLVAAAFFVFSASFFILIPNHALAGFGVSPGKIIEDRLVRGTSIERVVYLIQGNPEEDLHVKVELEDNDTAKWIKIKPSNEFVIPKGTQQFPLTVNIDIPEDAPLGIYKNYIRATTISDDKLKLEEGSSGVQILVGARVDIELTVGEGVIYEYAIRGVDLRHIKETDFPIADISIENKGNVKAGPSEAAFELFNKFGDIRLAYVQGVKIGPVAPFRTENRPVEFPVSVRLAVGEYWGTVKLYNEKGEVIYEYKDIFNVRQSTWWDKYKRYVSYAVGALLFIILMFLIGRYSGKRKHKN